MHTNHPQTDQHRGSARIRPSTLPLLLLGCLVAVPPEAVAGCLKVAAGFQEFYVAGREDHIYDMFVDVDIAAGGGNDDVTQEQMESVVTLTATADGQVVYYDHWEDGYDDDPFNPGPTSQTFDLNQGQVLSLASDGSGTGLAAAVPTVPRGTDLRYDGGDRIISIGGPVGVVHSMWPLNYAYIGGAIEVYPRNTAEGGFFYLVPFGVDTYDGDTGQFAPFKHVWAELQAFEDGTFLRIENGTDTIVISLNRGESYSSRGAIGDAVAPSIVVNEGTRITASRPIQVAMVTASDGTYQSRFFTLLPRRLWGTDYVTPFIGPNNTARAANLYLFNPSEAAISATAFDTAIPAGVTFPIGAEAISAYSIDVGHLLPQNSPARLQSNDPFWGVVAVDYTGTTADWGFTLLPTPFLTDHIFASWSPGADDQVAPTGPDSNVSPLWIVPIADNVLVCVDLNGDGVSDNVDTDGNGSANAGNADYDANGSPDPGCYITHLMSNPPGLLIYDHLDFDNTGTQVWATQPFSASYGQDPDVSVGGGLAELDLGYTVTPSDARFQETALTVETTSNVSTVFETGGQVTYTGTVRSHGFGPLTNLALSAFLDAGLTYVPGSTVITLPDTSTLTGDPTETPSASGTTLDWGIVLGSMATSQQATVTFQVTVPGAGSVRRYTTLVRANADYASGPTFEATACVDVFKHYVLLNKSVDRASAAPGEVLTYTIQFQRSLNAGSRDTINDVVVRDVLPSGVRYVPGSATYTLSTDGPGVGTYNPATRTVSYPEFRARRSSLQNITGTFTFQAVVEADPLVGQVCNQADVRSLQDHIPMLASQWACTDVLLPALERTKSAPATVTPNQRFSYTLTVTNSGDLMATNVRVVDLVPVEVTYVAESMTLDTGSGPVPLTDDPLDADPGEWTGTVTRVTIPSLAIGATATVTFDVRAPVTLGPIANVGSADANSVRPGFTNLVVTSVVRSPAAITLTDAGRIPVADYIRGDRVYVEVVDADQNLNAAVAEQVTVIVSNPATGDSETVLLTEAALDLGRFFGAALLTVAPTGSPVLDDGMLEVGNFSQVVANYVDPADPGDAAEARAGIAVPQTASSLVFTDGGASPVSAYAVGDRVYVEVADGDQNVSPSVSEALTVVVSDPLTGDRETVNLTESGADAGVFFGGALLTAFDTGAPVIDDGVLETRSPSVLHADYADPTDPGDTASDTADIAVARTDAAIRFTNGAATPVTSYFIGSMLYVEVADLDQNLSPVTAEQVTVVITDPLTGDSETVTLSESGSDSGVYFGGSIATIYDTGSPVADDATLEVRNPSTLYADYVDPADPADTATTSAGIGATPSSSSIALTNAAASVRTLYTVGEFVYVEVSDGDQNLSPTVAERVTVMVSDPATGDAELVDLDETGPDVGQFFGGALPTLPETAAPVLGDGQLETRDGSQIVANYVDPGDPSDTAEARADVVRIAPGAIEITDALGVAVASLGAGDRAWIRVTDADQNFDIGIAESVLTSVTSVATGDVESVTCLETGLSTGTFLSSVGLDLMPATTAPVHGDGVLEVIAGDRLIATYVDPNDPGDTSDDDVAVVGTNLLRNDATSALSPLTPNRGSIYLDAADPSLERTGGNSITDVGEGPDPTANGSDDDDDFYIPLVTSPFEDPDSGVVTDAARPLVIYQSDVVGQVLKLTKSGSTVRVEF